jgi:hypothetical protein
MYNIHKSVEWKFARPVKEGLMTLLCDVEVLKERIKDERPE